MCQNLGKNTVMTKMGKLLGPFSPGLGKLACGKMFGRHFGMVTTKIFHPKDEF